MAFWALKTVSPVDGRVGWTVVDDDYEVQSQAAAFLYALRFAADRAEGTCRTYARDLSLFFTWLADTGRDWRCVGSDDLASFVLWLERTPSRRDRYGRRRAAADVVGLGDGRRVRAASTVNGVLAAVRELYRWLAAHDQVDVRFVERLAASRLRKKTVQRRPEHQRDEQVQALLEVCSNARDRFLVLVMWRCGLRLSEALGLRREDVHFLPSSGHVGCEVPGAHVHVIRRDGNENGAWAKSRWPRYVPAPRDVVEGYAAYRWERTQVPAAAGSDFVFVNLWGGTVGRALTPAAEDLFVQLLRREIEKLRHRLGMTVAAELDAAVGGISAEAVASLHDQIADLQDALHDGTDRIKALEADNGELAESLDASRENYRQLMARVNARQAQPPALREETQDEQRATQGRASCPEATPAITRRQQDCGRRPPDPASGLVAV